ncbi:hypothetical protein Tdes44962_MAKER08951 [Teratosphaeria destructans]|uniref:F-box domain-containing protein n=1 Tax=Teratosphaeria destructans TaxID=418781 RepID=A0A9W7SV07_9PEZI|nr:hypothetical protein Tdes44962_MAKER08951 [Teratosphaeria destructans]
MAQRQSSLLSLPGELLNAIYEYVASATRKVNCFRSDLVLPPLALTCRQTLCEFPRIYHDLLNPTSLHVRLTDLSIDPVMQIFRSVKDNEIEDVQIDILLDRPGVAAVQTSGQWGAVWSAGREVAGIMQLQSLCRSQSAGKGRCVVSDEGLGRFCKGNWVEMEMLLEDWSDEIIVAPGGTRVKGARDLVLRVRVV